MANYSSDRAFTDHVHQALAQPLIYHALGWNPVSLAAAEAFELDCQQGIDYVFRDATQQLVRVQERFREVRYKAYTDFTIRYRRDQNRHPGRQASEYYKMKADYFVYGIVNGAKDGSLPVSGFEKYAVIALQKVYEQIDRGNIVIADNGWARCRHEGHRIICPVKYNPDGSSSFFPVDICLLAQLWPGTIIAQQGFYR